VADTRTTRGRGRKARRKDGLDPALAGELFRQMYLIRRFEEACSEAYTRGLVRGFLHLYIGQEAVAVGALSSLRPEDYIVTHYRDHGHALARGLDPNRAMAELFGRATGLSGGKGGSMHLFDASRNFMGGHAIVGAQYPLAAGLALSSKYKGDDALTVVFFGDGAVNQGTFHETLNLAAVWKLPLLFLLENNLYGMGTAVELSRAGGADIYKVAEPYGVEGVAVDGMDVLAVREATARAASQIRAGEGPKFVEAKTFRFQGHSMADPARYRDRSEVEEWEKKDPLRTFPQKMVEEGLLSVEDVDRIGSEAEAQVAESVRFAEESPEPAPEQLHTDIYA